MAPVPIRTIPASVLTLGLFLQPVMASTPELPDATDPAHSTTSPQGHQPTLSDLPSEDKIEFDCSEGGSATMRFLGPETIALVFIEKTTVLPGERATSGAKYGADGVIFWNKGDMAMIEIAGTRYACERIR